MVDLIGRAFFPARVVRVILFYSLRVWKKWEWGIGAQHVATASSPPLCLLLSSPGLRLLASLYASCPHVRGFVVTQLLFCLFFAVCFRRFSFFLSSGVEAGERTRERTAGYCRKVYIARGAFALRACVNVWWSF